jgi:acetyl-CoA carboxylase carboxyl transferase subunit alpha
MASNEYRLPFEQPIFELEARIEKLQRLVPQGVETRDELRRLGRELTTRKKEIYSQLRPSETVDVARHPHRPMTTDYLELTFDEFVELHGDKTFGDDRAIRTGWAKLDVFKVMVVGHQKGRNLKERNACYFGCAHPEGYRKAMAKMRLAAKFHMPVVCFIDTPGAYPGIGAEERGQAQVIATSMLEMSRLPTPIVCVVIGEGGSGGALGIGVGDRVAMLEHAYYSVISPEGCAGILWRSDAYRHQAAEALKMTSKDLPALGVIDEVIPEPLGGAHRNPHLMASRMKMFLRNQLRQLVDIPIDELLEARYQRFRRLGRFLETAGGTAGAPEADGEMPAPADKPPPAAVVPSPKAKANRALGSVPH